MTLRDPGASARGVSQEDRRLAPAAQRFSTFLTTSGAKVLRSG
jgi:hypothetical protein